jgi:glycosyltransferase involved in cell wall biosynthesis
LLTDDLVEFVGEVDEQEKCAFLGKARALLFPIDWPEPFGLVMIEAMSSGTPVIAWRNGSVPEVISNGESGFIVDSIDEAVAAVKASTHLQRLKVRRYFESRFTAEHMASAYVHAYNALVQSSHSPKLHLVAAT